MRREADIASSVQLKRRQPRNAARPRPAPALPVALADTGDYQPGHRRIGRGNGDPGLSGNGSDRADLTVVASHFPLGGKADVTWMCTHVAVWLNSDIVTFLI